MGLDKIKLTRHPRRLPTGINTKGREFIKEGGGVRDQEEKEEGMKGKTEEEEDQEGSPPILPFQWDVYLSFRGIDTRHPFIESLYKELERNNLRTFVDGEGLETEEEIITPAIEESAASIAVISKSYACSRKCLEELDKLVKCGRLMIPVFYGVDPSHVRSQKGPFEAAFRNLEQPIGAGEDKVQRWRKAMETAGGRKGFDSRGREDSQLIQDLVKKILPQVINTPLDVAKHPVGINSRVMDLMRVLDVKSNDVRVVGLHGMGGIGKTTLVKAVYNRIISQFEHHSFISNIRETSTKENGLVSLQNKLMHDLSPDNVSPVDEVDDGIFHIRKKIHDKKVLFVLDDVDDVCQLDALAGGRDWFYQGSRIIITTRDKDVLREQLVNKFYEVEQLSFTESLQLFSCHAFRREKPPKPFMHLCEEIVSLTGRLPLALEVFGASLFYERGIKDWKDVLKRMREFPPRDVQDVLKISYDRLNEVEKCIFLDIACFFGTMGITRESVIDILRGCGFDAETAINDLTAKSLIKIIDDNILWMHDQLRDMGRQVVGKEIDLGKRSRLWDRREIMRLLTIGKGTSAVEGITLDFQDRLIFEDKLRNKNLSSDELSKINSSRRWSITSLKEKIKHSSDVEAEKNKEWTLYTKQFEPMSNLRLLQINEANLDGKFKFMPAELKWLQWKGCRLEALPSDFRTQKLAVLDLSDSKIKQVWDQRQWGRHHKMAEELIVMNLLGCCNLTATPDFSGNTKLEKLILERCKELTVIHESIGELNNLRLLNLRNCSNLEEFPNDISGLRNLKTLILSGCSKLKELPEDLSPMESLMELLVDETAIVKLPDSIFNLKKLEKFSLKNSLSLKQLPKSIGKLVSLRELSLNGSSALTEIPDSIGSLTNLEVLSLIHCKSITAIPDSIGGLKSLLELFLGATSIEELPDSIGSLSYLKHLSVTSCRLLSKLPVSIGGLTSMVDFQLDWTSITELPEQIGTLNMLGNLVMRNCESFGFLPKSIGNMLSLTTLVLESCIIKELPESIGLLEKLEVLILDKCKQLSRLPTSIGKLKSLYRLQMEETSVLELPEEFGMLPSLRVLKMAKPPHLEKPQNTGEHTEQTAVSAKESHPKLSVLPTSFSNLSLLNELDARSCKISGMIPDNFKNLSSLKLLCLGHNNICGLPSNLIGLSVLTELRLPHCAELKSLPLLPPSLTHVDVSNCTALESISDLSNLESLQELNITNCEKVVDIPGLDCLKSLKRLYMSGCTGCHSVVKGRLSKVALKYIRNLSVPGSEIPDWFVQGVLSFSSLSSKYRKIKGVIICVVISLNQEIQDDFRNKVPAIVDIKACIFRENMSGPIYTTVMYLLGVPKTNEDQIYLCRYHEFTPLVMLLRDGDKIQMTTRDPTKFRGLELKKYGTYLVFEDDDDDEDDEESLEEKDQSVSHKLVKFFSSLE